MIPSETETKVLISKPTMIELSSTPGGSEPPSGFILKLYQMVNGAPDEVISWTQDGDAFVIGSDLKRLEEETLPHYFRHNRFQSLVRQLNFYSFRKINRERNVWIYKHNLFRRDSPEDLHLVRRRTCPGMDGRKQRFSRANNVRKVPDDSTSLKSDDDSCSVEAGVLHSGFASAAEEASITSLKNLKRIKIDLRETNENWSDEYHLSLGNRAVTSMNNVIGAINAKIDANLLTHVDTSLMEFDVVEPSVCNEDQISLGEGNDEQTEVVEQSIIVSDVAMKLEQFSKKAIIGFSAMRTRRGGSGVVTPPFSSSSVATPRGIITYDDELRFRNDDSRLIDLSENDIRSIRKEVAFTSTTSTPNRSDLVTPTKSVTDRQTIEGIVQRILRLSFERSLESSSTIAFVAGFCMSMYPQAGVEMYQKIIDLISSCESLASEFQHYRSALHPTEPVAFKTSPSLLCSAYLKKGPRDILSFHDTLQSEGNQSDTIKDFTVFAVNCLHKLLSWNESNRRFGGNKEGTNLASCLSTEDVMYLEKAVDLWKESI